MTTENKITGETLIEEVRTVLGKAVHGKNKTPAFLSTYQILNRIPSRDGLVTQEGGPGGKGFGDKGGGAAHVVKNAITFLRKSGEVRTFYFDGNDEVKFKVGAEFIEPGNQTFAIHQFTGVETDADIE